MTFLQFAAQNIADTLSKLDTYIYPMIVLVIWNFVTTRKAKLEIYGEDADPTNDGVLSDVADLDERVTKLEYQERQESDDDYRYEK